VRLEPTLSQSLHLLNGGTVEPKIAQGNIVGKMLQEKKTPAQVIEHLYIRCLSRAPKPDELKNLLAMVNAAKDKKQALDDVFWAIMNSREFMFLELAGQPLVSFDDGGHLCLRSCRFGLDPAVALLFQLERQLLAA
jgi:hypothetical protein